MANVFDQGARYTIRLDIPRFLPWVLGPATAALFRFREWLDTRSVPYPGDRDRVCDTAAGLDSLLNPDWLGALLMDPQTTVDRAMLFRVGEYAICLARDLRCGRRPGEHYQVGAMVLNLTGGEQEGVLDMHLPGVDPLQLGLTFRVRILRLSRMPAADTLVGIARGDWGRCVLPFVPLLHGGADADTIEEWKRLAAAEPDDRRRADYAGLAQVFATLRAGEQRWQEALQEWNVLTSPIVEKWKAEAAEVAAAAATRTANLNEARRIVVLLGRERWGEPPAGKLAALEAVSDLTALEQMAVRLLRVNTWDELLGT